MRPAGASVDTCCTPSVPKVALMSWSSLLSSSTSWLFMASSSSTDRSRVWESGPSCSEWGPDSSRSSSYRGSHITREIPVTGHMAESSLAPPSPHRPPSFTMMLHGAAF